MSSVDSTWEGAHSVTRRLWRPMQGPDLAQASRWGSLTLSNTIWEGNTLRINFFSHLISGVSILSRHLVFEGCHLHFVHVYITADEFKCPLWSLHSWGAHYTAQLGIIADGQWVGRE